MELRGSRGWGRKGLHTGLRVRAGIHACCGCVHLSDRGGEQVQELQSSAAEGVRVVEVIGGAPRVHVEAGVEAEGPAEVLGVCRGAQGIQLVAIESAGDGSDRRGFGSGLGGGLGGGRISE